MLKYTNTKGTIRWYHFAGTSKNIKVITPQVFLAVGQEIQL